MLEYDLIYFTNKEVVRLGGSKASIIWHINPDDTMILLPEIDMRQEDFSDFDIQYAYSNAYKQGLINIPTAPIFTEVGEWRVNPLVLSEINQLVEDMNEEHELRDAYENRLTNALVLNHWIILAILVILFTIIIIHGFC